MSADQPPLDDFDPRFHPAYAPGGSLPPLHVERLYETIGLEFPLDEVARRIRTYVQSEHPPVVGAMHVHCSDEVERECSEAFQVHFVRYLLPSFKFFEKAAFRSSNLGARYEWGAARIAEQHYSLARGDWTLMVVKVNAHVSVEDTPAGPVYGRMNRYNTESVYCGALNAVIDGQVEPFALDLTSSFSFAGIDRLSVLRDPARVEPRVRKLFAAVTSARLQARKAMIDIQDYTPLAPTLYLVLPCVTLNRQGHDTELICGIYTADRREAEPHDEYCGLSDLPGNFELEHEGSSLRITDPTCRVPRRARDHRSAVRQQWQREARDERVGPEVKQALQALALKSKQDRTVAKAALQTALALALEASPIPAAVLLFGEGLVHVHHAHQAHALAREAQNDWAARKMLREIQGRIEGLEPERAQHLLELLHLEYGT